MPCHAIPFICQTNTQMPLANKRVNIYTILQATEYGEPKWTIDAILK